MFKKFETTNPGTLLPGIGKLDDKFAIEGSSAYAKEKVISELAVQQEAERLKKDSDGTTVKSILHGGAIKNNDVSVVNTSTSKFSPFRSQRNPSVGATSGIQVAGIKGP